MTWLISILAIVGVILNIKKYRICFAIWLVTNGFWALHNLAIGEHAQAALFGIYFALSVYGLFEWENKQPGKFPDRMNPKPDRDKPDVVPPSQKYDVTMPYGGKY